jgi:uncharacterized cysteine cluster protein YcgN (CxxCxxCC family)
VAIALDHTSVSANVSDSQVTWPHTITSAKILVVCIIMQDPTDEDMTVQSVTHNGKDLVSANFRTVRTGECAVEYWYRINPDIGADLDIIVTCGGKCTDLQCTAISLSGVDTDTPFGDTFSLNSAINSYSSYTRILSLTGHITLLEGSWAIGAMIGDQKTLEIGTIVIGTELVALDLGNYFCAAAYAGPFAADTYDHDTFIGWDAGYSTTTWGVSTAIEIIAAAPPTELVIAVCAHVHTAANLDLTQKKIIQISSCAHVHTAENLDLIQYFTLVIADAAHLHTVENLDLIQYFILVIAACAHVHTAENLVLSQFFILVIADAAHLHTAENLDLEQAYIIQISSCAHVHTADNITLYVPSEKAPYRARTGKISGYHCFIGQYMKFTNEGKDPLKLPDGTLW